MVRQGVPPLCGRTLRTAHACVDNQASIPRHARILAPGRRPDVCHDLRSRRGNAELPNEPCSHTAPSGQHCVGCAVGVMVASMRLIAPAIPVPPTLTRRKADNTACFTFGSPPVLAHVNGGGGAEVLRVRAAACSDVRGQGSAMPVSKLLLHHLFTPGPGSTLACPAQGSVNHRPTFDAGSRGDFTPATQVQTTAVLFRS